MIRSSICNWAVVCSLVAAFVFAGCASDTTSGETSGSLNLNLELADGIVINEVDWEITGGDMEPMSGTIDTSAPGATASVEVFGLPPGDDYVVTLEATDESGEVSCRGDAEFEVEAGVATDVMVFLNCKLPTTLGGVRVDGKFNICAELAKVVVSPLQTSVGNDIDLSATTMDVEEDDVAIMWSATGGSIADDTANETTYTCGEVGGQSITVTVSDDDFDVCTHSWTVAVNCVEGDGGTGGTGGGAGGAGGGAGAGGTGGVPGGLATVTAAHFAPEIPTPENTTVAIYVDGVEVTGLTIEYGQTTGRVELPTPGIYDIGVGLPGGGEPIVELENVPLNDGDDIAAAAYRTGDGMAPVALFPYDLTTEGLGAADGRVFVSHGADAEVLDPVDIIVTDPGACPPPLLNNLEFGETRGGLDLAASTYNLGFDLEPGADCNAEVRFAAPVTPAVTSILVAVDEDTGVGLAPQVWALVDAETVVALIDCNVDADCGAGEICVANECRSDPDLFCDTGICTEDALAKADCIETFLVCIAENPNEEECIALSLLECNECNEDSECEEGFVCDDNNECVADVEVVYAQDFNALDIGAADALAGDGWLVFGNVFAAGSTDPYISYGVFTAPNGGQGFSALVNDQGGPEQEPQQLSIYSDYGCCQPSSGHLAGTDTVESSVFQEPYPNQPGQQIPASDIGKTFTFSFDAKRGNINSPTDPKCVSGGPEESVNPPCDTQALAYIQTLQPPSFNRTNYIVLDMTDLPVDWGRYEISLDLTDPALEGQVLQFGFRTLTNAFEPSGNFYDNVLATLSGGNGGGGDGELTINGDFETGDFSGWTNFCDNGDGSCTITQDNPNGGQFAARVSQPTLQQNAVIKQERIAAGEVATGDTIAVELFIRGSVGPGGVVFLELFSEEAGGGVTNEGLKGPFFPTGDWVQISESFTLAGSPDDGITVQIAAVTSGDTGSFVDLYVDDVSAVKQ